MTVIGGLSDVYATLAKFELAFLVFAGWAVACWAIVKFIMVVTRTPDPASKILGAASSDTHPLEYSTDDVTDLDAAVLWVPEDWVA